MVSLIVQVHPLPPKKPLIKLTIQTRIFGTFRSSSIPRLGYIWVPTLVLSYARTLEHE